MVVCCAIISQLTLTWFARCSFCAVGEREVIDRLRPAGVCHVSGPGRAGPVRGDNDVFMMETTHAERYTASATVLLEFDRP